MKGYIEEWFDDEIMETIKNRDKLLKKYKKSKLEVDHQIYREAKTKILQKILENTGNSKNSGKL